MGLFDFLKKKDKMRDIGESSIAAPNNDEINDIAKEIVRSIVGSKTLSDAERETLMEQYENPVYNYYIDIFPDIEPNELNNTGYSFKDIRAVINDGKKTVFYLLHSDNVNKAQNDLLSINKFIEEAKSLAPAIGLNYITVDNSLNFEPVKEDMGVSNNIYKFNYLYLTCTPFTEKGNKYKHPVTLHFLTKDYMETYTECKNRFRGEIDYLLNGQIGRIHILCTTNSGHYELLCAVKDKELILTKIEKYGGDYSERLLYSYKKK